MSYQHIDVKPISGALGAEIYGADLATLTDNAFTEDSRRVSRTSGDFLSRPNHNAAATS